MKTKLTKSILFLSILFSILFPVSSFAAIQETNDTIQEVIYEPLCASYYALTEDNNGTWVIYLLSSENENKAITEGLNGVLAGKKISLLYDDMGTNDVEQWEVVDWTILE